MEPIPINSKHRGGTPWTIHAPVVQPVRYVNQQASGGSFFAVFTLQLRPHAGSDELLFINELTADDPAQLFVPFIVEGLRDFADHRAREFRPVTDVTVSLMDVRLHPVDCKSWAFRRAAVLGMRQAFGDHGSPVSAADASFGSSRQMEQAGQDRIQALGEMMSAILSECYGQSYDGRWGYNDEYIVPELCRRAVEDKTAQFWCAGQVKPEFASTLVALATGLGHWVMPAESGSGYLPFNPFPMPKEHAQRVDNEQSNARLAISKGWRHYH